MVLQDNLINTLLNPRTSLTTIKNSMGGMTWYISFPAHNGNVKILDKTYNVFDLCKLKVFDNKVDIVPFLFAVYKSYTVSLHHILGDSGYIGVSGQNRYATLMEDYMLESMTRVEIMDHLEDQIFHSKKVNNWMEFGAVLAVRRSEVSMGQKELGTRSTDEFIDTDLYNLGEHIDYIIPELINFFAILFSSENTKTGTWSSGEEFEKDINEDITRVLNIDNSVVISMVLSYMFIKRINDEYLPPNRKLKLIDINVDRVFEKVFKDDSVIKKYLMGFASVSTVVKDRTKAKDESLNDIELELIAMYLGVNFAKDHNKELSHCGIGTVLRKYSCAVTRRYGQLYETELEINCASMHKLHLKEELKKYQELADRYKKDAQRDRVKAVEIDRELKKIRKEARRNEEAVNKLTKDLESANRNRSKTVPLDKYEKLEEENRTSSDKIKELTSMIEEIVNENREKTRKYSNVVKHNKKLNNIMQKYGLLDEEDSCVGVEYTTDENDSVDIDEKLECINQFKIALGGGWEEIADRLTALGVSNIVSINTVNEADKCAKYDILVIVADFISHTLAYKLTRQAESFGASKMYFSGTNANKLINDMYDLLIN